MDCHTQAKEKDLFNLFPSDEGDGAQRGPTPGHGRAYWGTQTYQKLVSEPESGFIIL